MAATNYILLTGSESRLAFQARQALDAAFDAKQKAADAAGALVKAAADGAVPLATALGFPTDTQGQDNANKVKDLVVQMSTDLNASTNITDAEQQLL